VDSAYRHIFLSEKLTLPRGEITSIDLHSNKFGDHYEFRYTTTAPIKIFLIKQKDIEGENPTPNFLLNQTLVGSGAKIIQVPANDQYAAIILKNENNYAADSYIRIDRVGKRPQSSTRNIENILNITIDALSKTYNLPNIKIIAKPCGEVNAFSTPNIVIGVVAQMPVAAEVGSGDERDELGSGEGPHDELQGLQRSVAGAR